MKNHKSSRKLRVGVNWYPGVNWSTTTRKRANNIKITSKGSQVFNVGQVLICQRGPTFDTFIKEKLLSLDVFQGLNNP